MSDEDQAMEGSPPKSTRRRALMLGAASASAIVTIRPALAQTGASVTNCEIPVPDPGRAGFYVAPDGQLVPPGTQGAFPPPGRAFKAEEVKRALAGGTLPGTDYERSRAYTNYIRRLQSGTSGFTCFASLQMPRG
ncbi:hypothetical protein ACFQ1E_09395 [Sphingomonas canadensis]|uniref:Uncharacterized protein n=1 Tax=Sphingomonas canadensis TaxID=1219257 RepID=A0ABW3H512_9SPHN|nr:hypothetical protein [Sphingomonas canadensis]MCW3836255.1 hypothetical protein [Sphingomonas canadensis]